MLNLQQYLKNRDLIKSNELSTQKVTRCFKCFRSIRFCFCAKIRPIKTHTKFVILMHPMEFKKERIGTGRLTHLSLPNSEIIMGVDFTNNDLVNHYIHSGDYNVSILYPEVKKAQLSENRGFDFNLEKPELIFLIDGTWPCAKKMMKESKNLHFLRRVTIAPSNLSQFKIKHQPHSMCLSTLEATCCLLQNLIDEKKEFLSEEDRANFNYLPSLLDEMVKIQIECVVDPNLNHYRSKRGNFKVASERKNSKKWDTRSIFYLGD